MIIMILIDFIFFTLIILIIKNYFENVIDLLSFCLKEKNIHVFVLF